MGTNTLFESWPGRNTYVNFRPSENLGYFLWGWGDGGGEGGNRLLPSVNLGYIHGDNYHLWIWGTLMGRGALCESGVLSWWEIPSVDLGYLHGAECSSVNWGYLHGAECSLSIGVTFMGRNALCQLGVPSWGKMPSVRQQSGEKKSMWIQG